MSSFVLTPSLLHLRFSADVAASILCPLAMKLFRPRSVGGCHLGVASDLMCPEFLTNNDVRFIMATLQEAGLHLYH